MHKPTSCLKVSSALGLCKASEITIAQALVIEGHSEARATLSFLIKSFLKLFLLKVILGKKVILSQPGHFYNTVQQQKSNTQNGE